MKKMLNHMSRFCLNRSFGLLLIRVATGLIFLLHGWSKVNNLGGTEVMFAHMGFAGGVGTFIALLEVIGGLALILGVFTRAFAVAFGIEMLVAAFIGNFRGIIGLELYLSLVSFAIALMGSGRYSILPVECRECGGMICSGKAGDCPKAG